MAYLANLIELKRRLNEEPISWEDMVNALLLNLIAERQVLESQERIEETTARIDASTEQPASTASSTKDSPSDAEHWETQSHINSEVMGAIGMLLEDVRQLKMASTTAPIPPSPPLDPPMTIRKAEDTSTTTSTGPAVASSECAHQVNLYNPYPTQRWLKLHGDFPEAGLKCSACGVSILIELTPVPVADPTTSISQRSASSSSVANSVEGGAPSRSRSCGDGGHWFSNGQRACACGDLDWVDPSELSKP